MQFRLLPSDTDSVALKPMDTCVLSRVQKHLMVAWHLHIQRLDAYMNIDCRLSGSYIVSTIRLPLVGLERTYACNGIWCKTTKTAMLSRDVKRSSYCECAVDGTLVEPVHCVP